MGFGNSLCIVLFAYTDTCYNLFFYIATIIILLNLSQILSPLKPFQDFSIKARLKCLSHVYSTVCDTAMTSVISLTTHALSYFSTLTSRLFPEQIKPAHTLQPAHLFLLGLKCSSPRYLHGAWLLLIQVVVAVTSTERPSLITWPKVTSHSLILSIPISCLTFVLNYHKRISMFFVLIL